MSKQNISNEFFLTSKNAINTNPKSVKTVEAIYTILEKETDPEKLQVINKIINTYIVVVDNQNTIACISPFFPKIIADKLVEIGYKYNNEDILKNCNQKVRECMEELNKF